MRFFSALALGLLCATSIAADAQNAKPFTADQVPGILKPWLPWVMSDIEHDSCPFLYDRTTQHQCIWPTRLSLDVNEKGATFSYLLTVYDAQNKKLQQIQLPGSHDRWPQDVKIDGKPAIVQSYNELPGLFLKQGTYTITGTYKWDTVPVSMQVPATTGLVKLTVDGHEIAIPEINGDQLHIQTTENTSVEKAQDNHLEGKLFRKVTDSIPPVIETYIRLQVSGKQREEALGKILPEGFIPLSIQADIPVRLESDGELRAQLWPGTWQIRIAARLPGSVETLKLPAKNGILSNQEIWSFEPQNNLRLAQVEKVTAIDPSQTEMPEEWRSFPAYLMNRDSQFTITEKKRGISDQVPDQLNLARDIWLDFSGKGFTFKDTINGMIHQSSRLEVSDGIVLGDAAINAKSQYITTITGQDKKSNPGVEVREGAINMNAGSRIESSDSEFSATGWKGNFNYVTARLYLPPGWSLFSYSGVDHMSGSWIGQWSLLDIFLVLLAVVAIYKLFGWQNAAIGLLALILAQHELNGFTNMILVILATVAILRYTPKGRLHFLVTLAQRLVFFLLICALLPFMVMHIRTAIYPQLKTYSQQYSPYNANAVQETVVSGGDSGYLSSEEKPQYRDANMATDNINRVDLPSPPVMMPSPAPMMAQPMLKDTRGIIAHNIKAGREKYAKKAKESVMPISPTAMPQPEETYQKYAPDTKVQTGFGNASWRNNALTMIWSGAVDDSVKVKLYLLSANQNLILACIRVVLMVFLLALLANISVAHWGQKLFARGQTAALVLLGLMFLLPPGTADAKMQANMMAKPQSADASNFASDLAFPSSELLQELKAKLEQTINETPACAPNCATVARMHISVSGNTLAIIEEVHAAENVVLPLPGNLSNWRPSTVLVDESPASGLVKGENDYLQVNLTAGVHHVKMVGVLPSGRDAVGISLPVFTHYTSSDASGWDVQGVRENGLAENSIQLVRTTKQAAQKEKTLEPTSITPFFELERTYTLAQQWLVMTTVRRITPTQEPASVHIPLLVGETVTSSGVQIKNAEAYVNFDPGMSEVTWQSIIKPAAALNMTAAKGKPWVEIWRMSTSNLWHTNVTGIPRVYAADSNATGGFWQWQPWPGESVSIEVIRPAGVEGETSTLDDSRLTVIPGQRSMEMTLDMHVRSSLGGQHELVLPEGAVLLEAHRGGMVLPVQLKQGVLSLPLVPGENNFQIRWKHEDALSAAFRVPVIKHGFSRSMNADITVQVPSDRWILFADGPQMGPAILFWSWIPVILLLSFGLGKLSLTPLRMGHWFLLLLGLSQADILSNAVIIACLLAFGWRGANAKKITDGRLLNLIQVLLVFLALMSIRTLFASISMGLLGSPDMHVVGSESYGNQLHWYQDITAALLPQPVVISVSIWVYRILMLLWSLWLAFSLVRWLSWGRKSFTENGYWYKKEKTTQG